MPRPRPLPPSLFYIALWEKGVNQNQGPKYPVLLFPCPWPSVPTHHLCVGGHAWCRVPVDALMYGVSHQGPVTREKQKRVSGPCGRISPFLICPHKAAFVVNAGAVIRQPRPRHAAAPGAKRRAPCGGARPASRGQGRGRSLLHSHVHKTSLFVRKKSASYCLEAVCILNGTDGLCSISFGGWGELALLMQ